MAAIFEGQIDVQVLVPFYFLDGSVYMSID